MTQHETTTPDSSAACGRESSALTTALAEIETPALVIDAAVAARNIDAIQQHCDAAGLQYRPHIKTHKTVHFARAQVEAGAIGLNCQKLGEAEVMVEAGFDDILITFNILGEKKLARLAALHRRAERLAVTLDNVAVLRGLRSVFNRNERRLRVLVECDTGGGRCGVQSPEHAVQLAAGITNSPGLRFGGLLTYPAPGDGKAVEFMRRTRSLLLEQNIACDVISTGGSPALWQAASHGVFSEYRAGTCIFNDRSLVARGSCDLDDCAGRVLTTVVSRPRPERVVVDAGSKVLTSDLLGLTGHGLVVGHRDACIEGLSEEHGTLRVSAGSSLTVGDRVQIVPNHICVVVNQFDSMWLKDERDQCVELAVDARGLVV